MIEKLEDPYIESIGSPTVQVIPHPTPQELISKLNEIIDVVNEINEPLS